MKLFSKILILLLANFGIVPARSSPCREGISSIQKHIACIGKPCQITFSSKDINSGVYLYGILVNNKLIAHKKMMIIK